MNISNNLSSKPSLKGAMAAFFQQNSPDSVKVLFWKMFQCWVTKDCNHKGELRDEEIAMVFDQVIELLSVAYLVHQDGDLPVSQQEGSGHV